MHSLTHELSSLSFSERGQLHMPSSIIDNGYHPCPLHSILSTLHSTDTPLSYSDFMWAVYNLIWWLLRVIKNETPWCDAKSKICFLSTGKVVGGPLVNEVVLLVVLIWFLLLLLILIIILIAICCLPPVRLSPSSKTSNHSSEFLMKWQISRGVSDI